jgi:hypothetical protein
MYYSKIDGAGSVPEDGGQKCCDLRRSVSQAVNWPPDGGGNNAFRGGNKCFSNLNMRDDVRLRSGSARTFSTLSTTSTMHNYSYTLLQCPRGLRRTHEPSSDLHYPQPLHQRLRFLLLLQPAFKPNQPFFPQRKAIWLPRLTSPLVAKTLSMHSSAARKSPRGRFISYFASQTYDLT